MVTCLTGDPGVGRLTPVRSHTFMEIDHKIISTAILHLSADSRSLSVSSESIFCALSTGYLPSRAYRRKRCGKVN